MGGSVASGFREFKGKVIYRFVFFVLAANIVRISLGWAYRSYDQNRFANMAAGLQMDPRMGGWLMALCLLLILQIALAGVLIWWRLQAALLLTAILPLSMFVSRQLTHDKPGSWTGLLVFLSLVWLVMTVLFATFGWRQSDSVAQP